MELSAQRLAAHAALSSSASSAIDGSISGDSLLHKIALRGAYRVLLLAFCQRKVRHGSAELRSPESATPTASSAAVDSLRTKLAVAVQRNRDLTEEIAVLRTENEALRSRLLEQRSGPT